MDSNGLYVSHGAVACSEFLDARETDDARHHEWWIAGWLTATNFQRDSTFDVIPDDTSPADIIAWLEDYCRTHQSETLADGVVWLFRGLYPVRIQQAPAQ